MGQLLGRAWKGSSENIWSDPFILYRRRTWDPEGPSDWLIRLIQRWGTCLMDPPRPQLPLQPAQAQATPERQRREMGAAVVPLPSTRNGHGVL